MIGAYLVSRLKIARVGGRLDELPRCNVKSLAARRDMAADENLALESMCYASEG